jgi:hypothetical protein
VLVTPIVAIAVINQIGGFLIKRGMIVRQWSGRLRKALPEILSRRHSSLSSAMRRALRGRLGR